MELQQAKMAVSGIVVDPRGNPVEGVMVLAQDRFSRREISASYRPPTGKDGRFTITELPDVPLRLMARPPYARSSGSERPRIFAAYADAKPGQSDVRIVFDPKVAAAAEHSQATRPAAPAGKAR